MLRAGMIRQASAGIYSWLPLGFRVLQEDRADRARGAGQGAAHHPMLMPTIQSADLWQAVRALRRLRQGDAAHPGPPRARHALRADQRGADHRHLPPRCELQATCRKLLYHIQWKFRDEVRPRFGVMRGREFLMKDGYSFDLDYDGARHSYNKMFVSYLRTFARMGLKAIPMRADTGPIGGDLSHEFIILADTGESEVFCDKRPARLRRAGRPDIDYEDDDSSRAGRLLDQLYARTDEKHDPAAFERPCRRTRRIEGARHRGRPHLLLRHQVLRAAGRWSPTPDDQPGRRCTWAPTASACRAWSARSSRRATTTTASSGPRRWRPSRSA